jgi:hypothetical protein
MTRHVLSLVVCLTVFSGSGFAQQQPRPGPRPETPAAPAAPQAPSRPGVPGAPAAPGAPAVPPAPPAPPVVDPSAGGQPVNIRLDLSITDQQGTTPSAPKTVTLLLADRSLNQIRSSFEDRSLDVDARPTIVDGRIRLYMSIQSEPRRTPDNSNPAQWRQNQRITVIVESGKPLVVMESVDPASNNRKTTIEVKATILK